MKAVNTMMSPRKMIINRLGTVNTTDAAYEFQPDYHSLELCAALDTMSASMRNLMGILRKHNCITALPNDALADYERAVTGIADSVAAAQALTTITRRRARCVVLQRQ